MLSVGRFAKLTGISARTLRFYESIGLLPAAARGENNYRFYPQELVPHVEKIRHLQSLGFSLEEIKDLVNFSPVELRQRLQNRLAQVDENVLSLQAQRKNIELLLSVNEKINTGDALTDTERDFYMQAVRAEIIKELESKYPIINESQLSYLTRDRWLETQPQMDDFVRALKKCRDFAREHNLLLGPGRGSAPASMSIFGLGFSDIDPMKYDMIPERIGGSNPPEIHIDVEFERGQMFVDYCREVTAKLSFGEIHAFKMPLLDIIKNVNAALEKPIDIAEIDENSENVLADIRRGDISKIMNFDFSENALVMKYENFLPEYKNLAKITEYLQSQQIYNFRDVINITAVWRPNAPQMVERIKQYRDNKSNKFSYDFLPVELQKYLEPNFGMIIYHEDLLRIIAHYTEWDLMRCNLLRLNCRKRREVPDWNEFCRLAPKKVVNLVREECHWSFCKPHAIAFSQFTKWCAVLKSRHKELYFREIEKFEQKNGFTWDDIGIRLKGVSLLQH